MDRTKTGKTWGEELRQEAGKKIRRTGGVSGKSKEKEDGSAVTVQLQRSLMTLFRKWRGPNYENLRRGREGKGK